MRYDDDFSECEQRNVDKALHAVNIKHKASLSDLVAGKIVDLYLRMAIKIKTMKRNH